MIELIQIVFPLKLQLNILQLEEYQPLRFMNWIIKNFFKRNVPTKKALVYTTKVKNLIAIYLILLIISLPINIIIFLVLLTQPYFGLVLAVFILKPYEILKRYKTIKNTREKILSLKSLKVIGITGSFGKTSTKEILYQILNRKFKTLRTPESFNTIFGVAKVVDLELANKYEIFICEMAAYSIGEIKTLCNMIPPNYGILTGITTQHFERFGSLANTIKAKFELVDAIKNKKDIVFNLDDENVLAEIKVRNIKLGENAARAQNISFTKTGSNFELVINGKVYKISTLLFGSANIKNILLAVNMAIKLGLSEKEVVEAIKNLKPFENRNNLINDGKTTVVNNTYSSNIQSFKEMIETAKKVKGKKALMTPGIVELGVLESEVHKNLGVLSQNVFDKIILVGKNKRTNSFFEGLNGKAEFINDERSEYFKKIEEFKKTYNWIFLENDVTQNY